MFVGFSALQRQGTQSLVPYTVDNHIVGCHQVYKLNHHPDASIAQYKARFVAKGFYQEYGIDYNETFSPVVKHSAIRVVLALTVHFQWPLHQLDVTNAFLRGILQEDIYMLQPPGFVDSTLPNHVCKLHKSPYGLQQAPRDWFNCFSSYLTALGFHRTYADLSLFIKHHHASITIISLFSLWMIWSLLAIIVLILLTSSISLAWYLR